MATKKAPVKTGEKGLGGLLENWAELTTGVGSINEAEAWALLEKEKFGLCRRTFLGRIHGRANILRARRERDELNRVAAAAETKVSK